MKREIEVNYYTFMQNNSGGYFIEDYEKGIAAVIIIEAVTEEHAESIFSKIADSFEGDFYESCPCCGSRWCGIAEVAEKPEVFGMGFYNCAYNTYVHYLDGTKEHNL